MPKETIEDKVSGLPEIKRLDDVDKFLIQHVLGLNIGYGVLGEYLNIIPEK